MNDKGILYIVATPIGNLSDISQRAIDVFNSVATIAAEDTRHSKTLLNSLQVTTPMVSYHDFSSDAAVQKLLQILDGGKSVALISDAGTPLISDPGFKLVRAAREAGITVSPVPGASAMTAALSAAGLATDRFVFEGFLPNKTGSRVHRLESLQSETRTMVFYESPHRICDSVADMASVFGDERQMYIGRELTKRFESQMLGTIAQCRDWLQADPNQQKGEFVILLAGCEELDLEASKQQQALELVQLLQEELSTKAAVSLASKISGARKNKLYDAVIKMKPEMP